MSCKEFVFTFKLSSNTAVSTASFQPREDFVEQQTEALVYLRPHAEAWVDKDWLAAFVMRDSMSLKHWGDPANPCHTGARSTRAERLKPGQGLAMSPSISERNHRILEAPVNVSLTLPASLSLSLFVCIYEIR
jgi:hypothetical protein